MLASRRMAQLLTVLLGHPPKLNVTIVEFFPGDVPSQLVCDIIEMVLTVAYGAHIPQ